jgi:hypothetical protein
LNPFSNALTLNYLAVGVPQYRITSPSPPVCPNIVLPRRRRRCALIPYYLAVAVGVP